MKNKLRKYISIGLIIVMIFGFIYIGSQDYNTEQELSDHEKFSQEYPDISENNLYNYLTNSELNAILENGTGILLIANPESSWSSPYAKHLNDIAKAHNVNEINYYNIGHAKEIKNRQYLNLIEELKEHLITTDNSKENLFTPMTIFIKEGKVIAIDNTTAIMPNNLEPNNYWTEEKVNEFKTAISNNIAMIQE